VASETRILGVARVGWRHRLAPDLQVLIAIGTLLALLATGVGVAVYLIVSLEDDASYLSQRHVQYATAIHEAALSAKGMANDERGFLLSGNSEFLDEFEDRLLETRLAFSEAVLYAVSAQQRQAALDARADFDRWLRAVRRGITAFHGGNEERAIAGSLGPTRQLRKVHERSLADAYALGTRSVAAATNSVSDSASRSVTVLLVYLAVALVVGIGLAVWVVRTILKPAYALTRNAMDVLTRGRVLVEEGPPGSHRGVAVEVPIEVVNALAESALEAKEALRPRSDPAT
jgi:methyl-accepting chemotaxis protein